MKKVIVIGILFMGLVSMAQESDSESRAKNVYLELLSHTPKSFKIDRENKPLSQLLEADLNSIWKLKTAYELKDRLNDHEINWLEKEINQMAVSFFLEGKPIILQSVGGYSGCPEELLHTEIRNEVNVTIISLCQGGCIVNSDMEDFIKIFNNRTDKLISN
ncbi:hypothetical protein POV27_08490 [Aureisphaera galaxeae]|uniref:hypothetical protein n=1 Tax=Aureisphaera galaxeae TaxID=1538023 RepID=UPI002350700D|nr:hypothetical protein [Aureisphaera galaxeae]MDC8004089.1 hypothetical protein [Aureisphaera galaxeae]